jgi:hypothetical protein
MRYLAFGTVIEVQRVAGRWRVFIVGTEGKRRLAQDLIIPAAVAEDEIADYLDDLLHESATLEHPRVLRLP